MRQRQRGAGRGAVEVLFRHVGVVVLAAAAHMSAHVGGAVVEMRWGRASSLPALSENQDLTSMGELAAAPSSERGSAGVEKETVRLPHSPASMSPPPKWGRLPTEDISSSSEASSSGVELKRSS